MNRYFSLNLKREGEVMRRGLKDIKTHGTLAREGRLVSVAKNLHQTRGGQLDSWNIEQHIYYPKKKSAGSRPASLHRDLFLENKARRYQIAMTQDFLEEMRQAILEGIPVSVHELERLQKKLAKLQAE